jgi:hypothetical protein
MGETSVFMVNRYSVRSLLIGRLAELAKQVKCSAGVQSSARVVQKKSKHCDHDVQLYESDHVNWNSVERNDSGMFGFGGQATVVFISDGNIGPDGNRKVEPPTLRVELHKRMNLTGWEVSSISHEV